MRSRNIKPGFFKNDQLAALPPLARLLFAGLWTLADRAGRLEDRPARIKVELLPYDDVDVSKLLDQLAAGADPFVVRYEAKGVPYLQVVKWDKHQNPHVREAASAIPAPAPGQHRASTVQARLIPDSGFLIPDSLNPEPEASPRPEPKKPVASTAPRKERFVPPTVEEVRTYCATHGYDVDPVAFCAHYAAVDWYRGKTKLSNWKAAVVTWVRRRREGGS
jgi:hypothetical protein